MRNGRCSLPSVRCVRLLIDRCFIGVYYLRVVGVRGFAFRCCLFVVGCVLFVVCRRLLFGVLLCVVVACRC